MTIEFWTAFGSVGTLVVIAVTALIAVIQMRHLRAANQAIFLHNLLHEYEGPEFADAFRFVRVELAARLEDSSFRDELRSAFTDRAKHPEIVVLNFFDQLGHVYNSGSVDRDMFMQAFAGVIDSFWERLAPAIMLLQDPVKGNLSFQQFELLTLDARRWLKQYPDGKLPKGAQRIPLIDKWRDVGA